MSTSMHLEQPIESVDRRVLGGFYFANAITGASITDPLAVSSADLNLRVNRSGVYAILDAPGFSKLSNEFDLQPSDWPAAGTPFEITVQDPSLRLLGRRAKLVAPETLASLTTTQRVLLYPSPSGEVAPNWAVVRASVTGTSGAGLPWALLQVLDSGNTALATGMTDARGEALLAVTGLRVQVSSGSSGPVTETATPVTIKAWFNPATLQQPQGWVPDPDEVLDPVLDPSPKTGTYAGAIAPGQVLFANITVSV